MSNRNYRNYNYNESLKSGIQAKKTYLRRNDGKGYPIEYRLLVVHALLSLRLEFVKDEDAGSIKEKCLEAMNRVHGFILNFRDKKHGIYESGFLGLYPFSDKDGYVGLLVVDRSKACFPLVLYPDNIKSKHGPRIEGFKISVEEVLNSFEEIWQIMDSRVTSKAKLDLQTLWVDMKHDLDSVFQVVPYKDRQEKVG